jgi:two-component system, cell cycle sensor histidine kinase and response regulator CckA
VTRPENDHLIGVSDGVAELERGELAAIYDLGRAINFDLALGQTATAALRGVMKAVSPDLAFLFLRQGERLDLVDMLQAPAALRLGVFPEHRVVHCMCGLAVSEGRALYSRNIHDDPRCTWDECKEAGLVSFAALPLRSRDEIIGVVGLASGTERDFARQSRFLETLASQISVALANARLHEALQLELTERTRADARLLESERRFRKVVEQAPLAMAIVGIDGAIEFINHKAIDVFGYLPEDIPNMERWWAQAYPDDVYRQQVVSAWMGRVDKAVADDSEIAGDVYRVTCKDGTVKTVSISGVHVAGKLFVLFDDISERKHAEEILRENEEKFRIAFENAPTGMTIIRGDGRFLSVNPMFCQMVGYSSEELLSGTLNNITHPDDVEPGNLWIRRMISGDASQPEFEKRYIHKDGRIIWGVVRAQWVRNPDGSPRLSVVHVQDITERKIAEQALRESERRLREAHEIAQMGHWQLDLDDQSMIWGPGIYRLFATTPDEMSPTCAAFAAFVHPEDRDAVDRSSRAITDSRTTCDLVHRLRMSDGQIKHVRRICRVECDTASRPVRVTGILQDVTSIRLAEEERARLETQLHRAQKMEAIGYLAGGIAHDFNNLLTAIGGNASLALLGCPQDAPTRPLLTEINQAVASAADLTRQLLTFSRRQVIAPKVVNLNDVVAGLKKMLERLLGEDLELRTVLDPSLGHVRTDPGQAEQVLVNLAVNARDAMLDGGKLTIETANVSLDEAYCNEHRHVHPGDYVMLAVSDDGAGMTEETKAHLFEPFFTTKELGKGTGLGLAMIYGAIRQNNGQIEVYSEIGQGTTFKIYLPRVDELPEAVQAKPPAVSPRGSETLVLVEDDAQVRALALQVLERQGYRVRAFPGADEALAAMRQTDGPIHLIITDVVMPGMNGRVFSERAREIAPDVKVLFTSGYTRDVIAHHGVLDEGIEFLPKPYTVESLARRVREVLDQDARAGQLR